MAKSHKGLFLVPAMLPTSDLSHLSWPNRNICSEKDVLRAEVSAVFTPKGGCETQVREYKGVAV